MTCKGTSDLKRRWMQGAADYRDRSAEGIMRGKTTASATGCSCTDQNALAWQLDSLAPVMYADDESLDKVFHELT